MSMTREELHTLIGEASFKLEEVGEMIERAIAEDEECLDVEKAKNLYKQIRSLVGIVGETTYSLADYQNCFDDPFVPCIPGEHVLYGQEWEGDEDLHPSRGER